jgi:DNA-binding transcriptional LysR family regulator
MDCFPEGNNERSGPVDQLQGMRVFVAVAQRAGFAAAARELDVSTASVSKHVTALETRIGTRLFDRTTRRVGLTEAGRVYLERCLECLQTFEDADASVGELVQAPKGTLRVTAPIDFGDRLMPVVAEVMSTHPNIMIDLRLTNRVVDLVEEGIDVGVRIAPGLDGRYVARPLARTRLGIFGAPEYLRRHGRPSRPEDLKSHRSLIFAEPRPLDEVLFTRGRRQVRVRLNVVMASNYGAALLDAACRGLGLWVAPSFRIADAVKEGRLEQILTDWALMEATVFAVYPHRRFVSPKVRVFIEALRAAFGDGTRDPWWPDTSAAANDRPVGSPPDRRPSRAPAAPPRSRGRAVRRALGGS